MSRQRLYPTTVFDERNGSRQLVHRVASADGGAVRMACGLLVFGSRFGTWSRPTITPPAADEACRACTE